MVIWKFTASLPSVSTNFESFLLKSQISQRADDVASRRKKALADDAAQVYEKPPGVLSSL